ncbi:MAG: Ig-like domain-containing protein [Kofleriaceae bacterium]
MPKVSVAVLLMLTSTALARPHVDANGNLIRDAHSCGTTTTPYPVPNIATFATPGTRIIYLNKNGGTYNVTSGATDAATNTANRIASGDGATHMNAVIPPIDAVFDWNYIVKCVKAQYKPYNVVITETEPTSGNYVEAVVGGDGASTGWSASSGILGVASADNFCGVTEKGIAFSFAHNHIGIAKPNDELCATVAHEVGHLLALEHEVASKDTMSYVPFQSSGAKSFTDPSSQCGTDTQNTNACSCTQTAPNMTSSGMRLTQFVGLRPVETNPPTLDVKDPGDNVTLPPSFVVTADASDETAMDQVAVLLGANTMGSSSQPAGTTYTIPVNNAAEGTYTLEVQAIDLAGNITKKDLAVVIAKSELGGNCLNSADCTANMCAENTDGSHFCTQVCDDANACPDGFDCTAAGDQSLCVKSSGGCNIGGGDGRTLVVLVGLSLAIVLRRRRRS